MRKWLFIFILLPILGISQVYQAGTVFSYYYDINPDTLLNYHFAGSSHVETESFYVDVNHDSQNDIRLYIYAASSPGYGNGFLRLYSLNTNTFKRFGRFDSPTGQKVALPLSTGDSINSQVSVWDTTSLMIAFDNVFPGYNTISDWQVAADRYIGIKYETIMDTLFGWIRINCQEINPNVFCYVRDFSFQSVGVGIQEYEFNKINIYPNPTNHYLNFELNNKTKYSEIEITNTIGQTVLKQLFNKQIDVSSLNTGCYFIKLISENGTILHAKFLKE